MRGAIIYLREIIALMGPHAKRLPLLIVFGLILGLTDIFGLSLVIQFIGALLNPQTSSLVNSSGFALFQGGQSAGWALIPLFMMRAALGTFSYWYINTISGAVEAALRTDLLIRYQQMGYNERLQRGEAEFVNAINIWTMQYARGVLLPFVRFVSDAIVGVMVIGYLAYISLSSFALFLGLIGGVGLIYDRAFRRRGQTYARQFRALSSQVISDVQQCLEGYKEIRVAELEGYFQQKLRRDASEICSAIAKANTISQSPRLIIEAVVVLFVVLSLSLFDTTAQGTQTLPLLAAFAVGGMRIIGLTSLASGTFFNLRLYRQIVHQLVIDYSAKPEVTPSYNAHDKKLSFTSLQTSNLSFSYAPDSPPIFSDISFSLKAGDKLVILGPSGCGKTTLVDVLLGIIRPSSGAVEVRCAGEQQARGNLVGVATYLSQNTFIMNDTLRRNVALGYDDAQIDDARVSDALIKAKLPEFANQLDMVLGDRGGKISGGQRQRVALARALYMGRSVLILDEATNALDAATEASIIADLLEAAQGITLVVITHRPEIAGLFNHKLAYENGRFSHSS